MDNRVLNRNCQHLASFDTRHFVLLVLLAVGRGRGTAGSPLHLRGVLDRPCGHVELVGEDGEQRQDVLEEQRLLLQSGVQFNRHFGFSAQHLVKTGPSS